MANRTVKIIGAGSAGLISACILAKKCPSLDIAVFDPSHIPIIGVGESTVPDIKNFIHDIMGVPFDVFYKEVNPVYKLAISFEGWAKNHFYFTLERDEIFLTNTPHVSTYHELYSNSLLRRFLNTDPEFGLNSIPNYTFSYHLDNKKLIPFLKNLAKENGVKFIDDEIMDEVKIDGKSVLVGKKDKYKADFVVDASGFKAKMADRYDFGYLSYSDKIKTNCAIVGSKKHNHTPRYYTISRAMDSGWLWGLDHFDRTTYGYVHSKDHVSQEEIDRVSSDLDNPSVVNFDNFRREKSWVDNIIMIGNSAGFVEPLESTALSCAIRGAHILSYYIDTPNPKSFINMYNEKMNNLWDIIVSFIECHYRFYSGKKTPFWDDAIDIELSDISLNYINCFKENGAAYNPLMDYYEDMLITYDNYINIFLGLMKNDSNEDTATYKDREREILRENGTHSFGHLAHGSLS